MDLYVQVGLLLIMAIMFALLAYFYGVAKDIGIETQAELEKDSVSYSLDSSITSPTFYVDYRTFVQWALNASDQRQVYLIYPQTIEPATSAYEQYMWEVTINNGKSTVSVEPQVGHTPNAFFIDEPSGKVVDYLRIFAEEAKKNAQDGTVTVRTYSSSSSKETIYLAFVE